MKNISKLLFAAFIALIFMSIATAVDNKENISANRTNPSQLDFRISNHGGAEDKGFCDSPKGCRALKKACLKLKGHKYTPTNSGGVCTKDSANQSSSKKSIGGLKSTIDETEDATCFGRALCKQLRRSCQGTWEQDSSGTYGKCKDDD